MAFLEANVRSDFQVVPVLASVTRTEFCIFVHSEFFNTGCLMTESITNNEEFGIWTEKMR